MIKKNVFGCVTYCSRLYLSTFYTCARLQMSHCLNVWLHGAAMAVTQSSRPLPSVRLLKAVWSTGVWLLPCQLDLLLKTTTIREKEPWNACYCWAPASHSQSPETPIHHNLITAPGVWMPIVFTQLEWPSPGAHAVTVVLLQPPPLPFARLFFFFFDTFTRFPCTCSTNLCGKSCFKG